MTWDDRSRQPPRDVACTSSFAGTCIRNMATGFPWLRPPIAESKIDQWIPWCWVTQTVILAERVTCLICELHAITPWACTCDVMMWITWSCAAEEIINTQWTTNKRWYSTLILKYYFLTDGLRLDIYFWSIFISFSLIEKYGNPRCTWRGCKIV